MFIPQPQIDRIRVQAIPQWQCNLYDYKAAKPFGRFCAYCNLFSDGGYVDFGSKRLTLGPQMTAREWLQGMHRVIQASGKKVLWDFTGGEPMMYQEMPQLLMGARSYSDWAITSNTLLRKQIERVFDAHVDRCASWTASWHPGSGREIGEFIANLKFVQQHSDYVSVTIVLHPSTKHRIKQDLQVLSEHVPVQIHLFHAEGFSLAKSEDAELRDLYEELKPLNRAPAEAWCETPEGVPTPRDCVALSHSCVVSSDGAVYPCYQATLVEFDPPVGKWGTWIPNQDIYRGCTWPCSFACDLRNVVSSQVSITANAGLV